MTHMTNIIDVSPIGVRYGHTRPILHPHHKDWLAFFANIGTTVQLVAGVAAVAVLHFTAPH
jgi:hypothetical protein